MSGQQTYSLDEIRADGWFERLGEGSPSFEQLCELVGARFVACAVVAGVRITSVSVDPRMPDASLIDFSIGENGAGQRLPLAEFRRRLASAMLVEDDPDPPFPAKPTTDDLTAAIGFRYVLLSPIFGIRLNELRVVGGVPTRLIVELGDETEEIGIYELRQAIKEQIRSEAQKTRPSSPFAIDLNAVPRALEAAEAGEHDVVVEILGAWPGPLSMLLRTAEGQTLSPEVRVTLARALGVLGTAYANLERIEWAQEVLRLGIQWAQDGAVAGDLFARLARANLTDGRDGEAIGLFRRAIQLGAPKSEILPQLAQSFSARNRHLAAMVCVEDALLEGAAEDAIRGTRDEAIGALGDAWHRFQAFLAD